MSAFRRNPSSSSSSLLVLLRLLGLAALLGLVAGEASAEGDGLESGEMSAKKKDYIDDEESDSWLGYWIDGWLCWFGWDRWSGSACIRKKVLHKRVQTPEGKPIHDDYGCEGEQIDGYLEKFCGQDFPEDKVFYCPCCADHLMGDLPKRASLLQPGRETEVPAWQRDHEGGECRAGYLRTYTLGGDRIPTAWCDRGRLACECSDPHQEWHEEELWCGKGTQCKPPDPPEELHFEVQGPLEAGDRVRSIQEIEYKLNSHDVLMDDDEMAILRFQTDNETEYVNMTGEFSPCQQVIAGTGIRIGPGALGTVMEVLPVIVVEWDDYPQIGAALAYRPQITRYSQDEDENPEGLPFCVNGGGGHERMAIGYTMCDYYAVDQCHEYYSKYIDGTWHFCEANPHRVRMCGSEPTLISDAEENSHKYLLWAIDWGWRPDKAPDWPYSFDKRHTIKPDHDPEPPEEDVQWVLREEGHEELEQEDASRRHERHAPHRHKYHRKHHARRHHGHEHHKKKKKHHKEQVSEMEESEGEEEEEDSEE